MSSGGTWIRSASMPNSLRDRLPRVDTVFSFFSTGRDFRSCLILFSSGGAGGTYFGCARGLDGSFLKGASEISEKSNGIWSNDFAILIVKIRLLCVAKFKYRS